MIKALKFLALTLTGLVAILFLAVAIIDSLNWNRYRDDIATLSKHFLGRELRIDGNLRGKLLTLTPWVEAENGHLDRSLAGAQPDVLRWRRFRIELHLLPLLRGHVDIESLEASGVRLKLTQTVAEEAPPQPATHSSRRASPTLPRVRHASVTDFKFVYQDSAADRHVHATVDQLFLLAGTTPEISTLEGAGDIDGLPFHTSGRIGFGEGSASRASTFRISLDLADNHLRLDGGSDDITNLAGLDVEWRLSGRNLTPVLAVTGLKAVGQVAPMDASGHLVANGRRFDLKWFLVHLGGSEVEGRFVAELGKEKPRLWARITAPMLRLKDLKNAYTPPTEVTTAKKEVASEKPSGPLFSDVKLPFAALKSVEGDALLRIGVLERQSGDDIIARDLSVEASLHKGYLKGELRAPYLARGSMSAKVSLDAAKEPALVNVDLRARQVAIDRLIGPILPEKLAKVAGEQRTELIRGDIGGSMTMSSAGDSPHALAANLDGNLSLAVENGRISAVLSGLLPLDVTSAAKGFFKRGHNTDLQCFIADFAVDQGVVRTKTFLLSTPDANLAANGHIDLGGETMRFAIQSFAKDFGIGSLNTPIEITGQLSRPKVKPLSDELAAKASGAAGFAAVGLPAAGLLPLVEPGLGDHGVCAAYARKIAEIRAKARNIAH